jgi:F-type H+-transporting ATPase subunit gamma
VANTREIARRISTIRNLGQVTKAMQMISASRLRRAQERALAARPYAQKTWELLQHLARAGAKAHPLLTVRPVHRLALVLIASDRGLCGGYNHNVIRHGLEYVRRSQAQPVYVAIGRKAREAVVAAGGDLIAEFEGVPAEITISYAAPIARLIEDAFMGRDIDAAAVAYTRFQSIGLQVAAIREILPIVPATHDGEKAAEGSADYLYEPNAETILSYLLPHSLDVELLGCLLESAASEHSARMVAMQNATDNAGEMVEDLTRTYNRARQAAITNEILDIVGATEALRVQGSR